MKLLGISQHIHKHMHKRTHPSTITYPSNNDYGKRFDKGLIVCFMGDRRETVVFSPVIIDTLYYFFMISLLVIYIP